MTVNTAIDTGTADGLVFGLRVGNEIHTVAAGRRGPDSTPLTANTPFPICSITKPATAALLHALAAKGAIDLDAPVLGTASIRQLLRHTGGVGTDWGGDIAALGNGEDTLARYAARADLIEELGAAWSYGNPGYWLAAHFAATAAGTSFEQALHDHVLIPAGMTDADCRPWADDPNALAHDEIDPRRSSYLAMPRARIASGGMRATVTDVLSFAAATWPEGPLGHLGVLGTAADDTEYAPAYGGRLWGPGWEAWKASDGTIVAGHSGVYGGFRTRLWSIPSRHTAVAVLAVGRASEDLVLDVASQIVEVTTGLQEPQAEPGPMTAPLESCTGEYVRRSGRYDVTVDGSALRVAIWTIDPDTGTSALDRTVTAHPFADETVSPRRHIEFLRDETGALTHLRVGLVAARRKH